MCCVWGFVCNVTSECLDNARKRDCGWVYPINEMKEDPGDILCVCEISVSDAGKQLQQEH